MSSGPRVARTTALPSGVVVSTVCLGRYTDLSELWETQVRGGLHHARSDQYTSGEAAMAGHALWVRVAHGELTPEAIHAMRGMQREDVQG